VWILGEEPVIAIPPRVFADLGPSGRYELSLSLFNAGPRTPEQPNQTIQLFWNGAPVDAAPRDLGIGFTNVAWMVDAPDALLRGADLKLQLSTCHVPGEGDTRCIAGGIEGLTITRYEPTNQ
jgi:hypothetical protein